MKPCPFPFDVTKLRESIISRWSFAARDVVVSKQGANLLVTYAIDEIINQWNSRPAQLAPVDTLKCVETITDCPQCNHQFTVKAYCYAGCKALASRAEPEEENLMQDLHHETDDIS